MINRIRDLASTSEIATAISALSDGELLRLKRAAQLRALGLRAIEWGDLMNEAIERALSGTRKWPKGVPIVAFMIQTIRSIANEHWRQSYESVTTLESDLASRDPDSVAPSLDDYARNSVDPSREIEARSALQEIEAIFRDDSIALEILYGLAEGSSPEEIQESNGMTASQYTSGQKRIRRKIARTFSEIQYGN